MSTLLDEALELWQFTRDGVIAEAETVPENSWDWKPGPLSRSVTQLVQHIAEFAYLASGELTRPDGDFQRTAYDALLNEYASHVQRVQGKGKLIRLLRDSHSHAEAKFREAGELFLLQYIRRFDGLYSTRLAWLYHAIEHESYHRGQLALYVRQMGHVPALTRAILGES